MFLSLNISHVPFYIIAKSRLHAFMMWILSSQTFMVESVLQITMEDKRVNFFKLFYPSFFFLANPKIWRNLNILWRWLNPDFFIHPLYPNTDLSSLSQQVPISVSPFKLRETLCSCPEGLRGRCLGVQGKVDVLLWDSYFHRFSSLPTLKVVISTSAFSLPSLSTMPSGVETVLLLYRVLCVYYCVTLI